MSPIQKFKKFLFPEKDREFNKKLVKLTIPMALQQLMMCCVFLFDTIIVSGLGDEYLGASGQSGHLTFLMWSGLFAISGAGSIYAAQYWGKDKDIVGVRKAFTTTLLFGAGIAIPFFIIGFFFRDQVMLILSQDPRTRELGSEYLSIVSFAYLFWFMTAMFCGVLRSVGITRIPMIASAVSIGINVLMDSVIVYGFLGFPRLEIKGAALSTVIGSLVELILLIVLARKSNVPITFSRKDIVRPDRLLLRKFTIAALPMMAKDQLWALGVTVYSICFTYLGVAQTAAYNAYSNLGEFMNIAFCSIGSAGGIMIGHELGSGKIDRAKNYAWRLLRLILITGLILCPVFILLSKVLLLPFPNLTADALRYAHQALVIISFVIWARGINFTNMNGILRAGGDTMGAAIIEVSTLWLFGVPLALLVCFYFGMPFWALMIVICLEEILKVGISIARVRSEKWARKLV
ncbi:MAG: MATE family efflux transporter [Clostridiaceae bacterium]|jgi:putative MATE family efflux protein|nr:MATE family efflux transporter [Oscillospiraceae bacterium]NLO62514.1 MATE family efflux transporter [Clostridiaceae bacterium]